MKEALTGKDRNMWEQAIDKEAHNYVRRGAVSADQKEVQQCLNAGASIVPFIDTFTIKTNENGAFNKAKYRGCAGGHLDKSIRYVNESPSSPVIDKAALNTLKALGVMREWNFNQKDIVAAYLCTEEKSPRVIKVSRLFMDRLIEAGLEVKTDSLLLACKKCIYGYDDCGKQFFELVKSVLLAIGFTQCPDEPCLFKITTNVHQHKEIVIIAIHVDDFFCADNSTPYFNHISNELNKYFEFDDCKPLTHFLGTSYEATSRGLLMHNEPLIRAAAAATGVTHANPKYTPFPPGATITDAASNPQEADEHAWGFRNVLGILSWISQHTRPDIQFHITSLASKQASPNKTDYQLLKRVVKYANTTKHYKQSLERSDAYSRGGPPSERRLRLSGMVDSDYGGCPVTRKCMSGLHITLNDTTDLIFPLQTSVPIISKANRQPTVSTSVNEGELKSATAGAKTLVYLDSVLKFMDDNIDTPRLYCDNKGAIAIAHGTGKRKRSKHIDIKHFYIRELIKERKLSLHHVSTDDNVSDAMTKSLGRTKFNKFRTLLGVVLPGTP